MAGVEGCLEGLTQLRIPGPPETLKTVLNLHVVVHALGESHPKLSLPQNARRRLSGRVVHEPPARLAELAGSLGGVREEGTGEPVPIGERTGCHLSTPMM